MASAAMLAIPLVRAQPARKIYRIAMVRVLARNRVEHDVAGLEQGLRDHGYEPSKDIVLEVRSAEGKVERLPDIAREVVLSRPEVIVAGPNEVITALKAATHDLPIVMGYGTEVIAAGYAMSFAKPGGNITGITWEFDRGATGIKRLEALKEIIPKMSRVAVLWDPPHQIYQTVFDAWALAQGWRMSWHQFSGHPGRDFAEMARFGAEAVFALTGVSMGSQRAEITARALQRRLPTSFPDSASVDVGGLMSYGPNIAGMFRAAAKHVDKILKGAKPGDIPIEQPTMFDLVINLKTAKALGLKIPHSVMLRASRVIE